MCSLKYNFLLEGLGVGGGCWGIRVGGGGGDLGGKLFDVSEFFC